MGIPYYYTYLIKKFNKKILISFNNNNLNYAFIDSNSVVYDICRDETDENQIIINVCNKLNSYLELFNCDELTYIAFDGLPPFAKIQQQRSRRYKSYITKLLLKSNVAWDTCAITTGTQFMNKLTESLFNYNFTKNVKISS